MSSRNATELGLSYEYRSGFRAPVITSVDTGGPADQAGIQQGDEILQADGLSMEDEQDVLQVMECVDQMLIVEPFEKVFRRLRRGNTGIWPGFYESHRIFGAHTTQAFKL
jgi:predicted metalloprotease with PDZ domain